MSQLKPIDKVEFWSERLRLAREQGDLRRSVFQATNEQWNKIDQAHKKILSNYIGPSDRVLDAGCGYGRSATLINWHDYVGVDQCAEFIEIAKSTTDKHRDIHFLVGNLSDLVLFADNYFDWVFGISLMVMIIDNLGRPVWDKMQKELLRVSANGVILLEYTDPEVYHLVKDNSLVWCSSVGPSKQTGWWTCGSCGHVYATHPCPKCYGPQPLDAAE